MSASPWFEPLAWSWAPGAVIGLLGALIGVLSARGRAAGKARGIATGLMVCGVVLALGFLIAGVAAKAAGQPFAIWYGFLMPGVAGVLAFSICFERPRRMDSGGKRDD